MWKEVAMVYFEVLSREFSGRKWIKPRATTIIIVGVPAEIQTQYLLYKILGCYSYSNPLRLDTNLESDGRGLFEGNSITALVRRG
jgi:chromosome condensin MukBEF MukE localization factor